MAQITITRILDGARNGVFHVAFLGNGTGEETDTVLIDPATSFDPALPAVPGLTIECLEYDLTGFSARLEFDYLTSDVPVWSMSEGAGGRADFTKFGGIRDRAPEADGLGKLKVTTKGLGLGDAGSLIVWVKKN